MTMLLGCLDLNKIAKRLRKLDRFMVDILKVRLSHGGLSGAVAETKWRQSHDGIFNNFRKEVEDERIMRMQKWALQNDINPNFAAAIMYQVMAESRNVQSGIMVAKCENHEEKINEGNASEVYAYQRKSLIDLTSVVAPTYERHYAEEFVGSKLYFNFEKKILKEVVLELDDKSLVIDLGCATGIFSRELSHEFASVHGYDISSHMIEEARKNTMGKSSNAQYQVWDLEEGLDLPENSVSLVIMNMGTASEIANINGLIENIRHCLKPGGKFFLSFYNAESVLSKISFVPWPMPLAAQIDKERRCLEVQYGNRIYSLYAHPRSVKEIEQLLSGFEIDNIYTYPTFGSILPDIVFHNEDDSGTVHCETEVKKLVKKIDTELSQSSIYAGTYIIVTGGKSLE